MPAEARRPRWGSPRGTSPLGRGLRRWRAAGLLTRAAGLPARAAARGPTRPSGPRGCARRRSPPAAARRRRRPGRLPPAGPGRGGRRLGGRWWRWPVNAALGCGGRCGGPGPSRWRRGGASSTETRRPPRWLGPRRGPPPPFTRCVRWASRGAERAGVPGVGSAEGALSRVGDLRQMDDRTVRGDRRARRGVAGPRARAHRRTGCFGARVLLRPHERGEGSVLHNCSSGWSWPSPSYRRLHPPTELERFAPSR